MVCGSQPPAGRHGGRAGAHSSAERGSSPATPAPPLRQAGSPPTCCAGAPPQACPEAAAAAAAAAAQYHQQHQVSTTSSQPAPAHNHQHQVSPQWSFPGEAPGRRSAGAPSAARCGSRAPRPCHRPRSLPPDQTMEYRPAAGASLRIAFSVLSSMIRLISALAFLTTCKASKTGAEGGSG